VINFRIEEGMKTEIENLILRCRSYRRFDSSYSLDRETLYFLIKLARLAPSAGNLQPIRYILSYQPEKNQKIFPYLHWAAYLKEWPGPSPNERPTGYIIVLGDKSITTTFGIDAGAATQNILLGAVALGLGGCIIGSVERERLRKSLNIPLKYEILHVIALGKPKETVVVENIKVGGNIYYYRDEKGIHHVPKRPLEELILDI